MLSCDWVGAFSPCRRFAECADKVYMRSSEKYTVMTNHFWLVWYRARSPMGPKHWSLFVTYDTDEEALTLGQHAIGIASSKAWRHIVEGVALL